MRISELARAVDLTIDTIRFYEKRGLLDGDHVARRVNGYREYGDDAVSRLRLIRQAKAAGFTLSEIGNVIGAWEEGAFEPQHKRDLLVRKIQEIEARIGDLQTVRTYLEQKLRTTVE